MLFYLYLIIIINYFRFVAMCVFSTVLNTCTYCHNPAFGRMIQSTIL